jgi:TRAP-type C4-dicarboxylate transport system permease small subunit
MYSGIPTTGLTYGIVYFAFGFFFSLAMLQVIIIHIIECFTQRRRETDDRSIVDAEK